MDIRLSWYRAVLSAILLFLLVFPCTVYAAGTEDDMPAVAERQNDGKPLISGSFEPLVLFWPLFFEPFEPGNMGYAFDINWETRGLNEMGAGLVLRKNRVALTVRHRTYADTVRQSGPFYGLYATAEWRKMYWSYGDSHINVGWVFPVPENAFVFQSLAAVGGIEAGVRFREGQFALTPYIGLGLTLSHNWGDLPMEADMGDFNWRNIASRALSIGLKLDIFYPFIPVAPVSF